VLESKLERLKQKLALADFPDELEGTEWAYGSPLSDIKRLTKYWYEEYDWRKAEAKLNEFPQFSVDIDVAGFETLNIHFVHQKSNVKGAIPLIFVHGWPGSFYEATHILPKLAESRGDIPAFDVVVPSLPNFGFSQGTKKKGFNISQHAEVCHKLMQLLGYDEYVGQGGDLGYFITRCMARDYPKSCKAIHINMAIPSQPTVTEHPVLYAKMQTTPLTDGEKAAIARGEWFRKEGMGYFGEHATKPQTIGYSMTDSPVGLLAWIYEKLHDWSDHDTSLPFRDEEVITWISIYYFSTAGPAASQRIYYEFSHDPEQSFETWGRYFPDVKLGIARFPKELGLAPKLWNQTMGPVVFESEYESGGHFAAWEEPDAIVDDLRKMFGKDGGAFAVVKGRTGYDN